jgi:hypothetical protein
MLKLKEKVCYTVSERTEEFVTELGALLDKYDVVLDGSDQYGHNEIYLGKEWTIWGGGWNNDRWGIYLNLDDLIIYRAGDKQRNKGKPILRIRREKEMGISVVGWQAVPISQEQIDLIEAALDVRLEEGDIAEIFMGGELLDEDRQPMSLKNGETAEMAQMADGTVILRRVKQGDEEE